MKIVFVANFHAPLDGLLTGRFVFLGEQLCQRGHDVELVVSDFYHDTKSPRIVESGKYATKITVLHEPSYRRNVSLRRLYSHWTFGRHAARYVRSLQGVDCIYCGMPALSSTYYMVRIAAERHIRLIVDVQDLWPEAFAMALPHPALRAFLAPLSYLATYAYRRADSVIGVSSTYVERALSENRKQAEGLAVYLGNNGKTFEEGRKHYHLTRTSQEIVLAYIGSMGLSYDIAHVLEALQKVAQRGRVKRPIRFVLMGGGEKEEQLRQLAAEIYPNTTFLGRKTYREMAGLLCGCDMAVNPIVKTSQASIINKVGDYALAGLPVINSQDCTEYRDLLDRYGCGINCRCENVDDMAEAIERLAMDDALRSEMALHAARLGKEKFDRNVTYQEIIDTIERLV